MTWFTENPWPPMLILAGVAGVLVILGDSRGRTVALACVIGAIGLYFLESAIVTSGEKVEQSLQTMLRAFIAEDLATINSQITDNAPELKDKAKQGLELVTLDDEFHMQDIIVTVADDGATAEAQLRANGRMTLRQSMTPYHAATRWRTVWKLTSGVWKLAEVHRLNPVNGEEIDAFARQ